MKSDLAPAAPSTEETVVSKLKATLKVQLWADEVLVVESDNRFLWGDVLNAVVNSPNKPLDIRNVIKPQGV